MHFYDLLKEKLRVNFHYHDIQYSYNSRTMKKIFAPHHELTFFV